MYLLRFSISPLPISTGWYALPLRLIIGFGFMQHCYAKLARGPEDFINVLHAMGLPVPFILGWATIIVVRNPPLVTANISFPFCRLGRRIQFGVTADTSDSVKARLRIRESILYAHRASTTSRPIAPAGAAM